MSEYIIIGLQILGILLLLYLVFRGKSEYIMNADIPPGIGSENVHLYTSGATLRDIGTVFSSTNQGVNTTLHSSDDPGKAYHVTIQPASESIMNRDIPKGLSQTGTVYTSGATMRVLGQSFSSTNQGRKAILHSSDDPSKSIAVVIKPYVRQ